MKKRSKAEKIAVTWSTCQWPHLLSYVPRECLSPRGRFTTDNRPPSLSAGITMESKTLVAVFKKYISFLFWWFYYFITIPSLSLPTYHQVLVTLGFEFTTVARIANFACYHLLFLHEVKMDNELLVTYHPNHK